MLLMIDNYDSFTWNLVQYLAELGAGVKVVRNDEYSVPELLAMQPEHVVISPGPCTPNEAGVSLAAIQAFAGLVPILGVCLGHQSIGQAFGAAVVRAAQPMHGKTSAVYHHNQGVFSGLNNPLIATRYHSLVVAADSVPAELAVTAWTQTEQGELEAIMGLQHNTLNIEGE